MVPGEKAAPVMSATQRSCPAAVRRLPPHRPSAPAALGLPAAAAAAPLRSRPSHCPRSGADHHCTDDRLISKVYQTHYQAEPVREDF